MYLLGFQLKPRSKKQIDKELRKATYKLNKTSQTKHTQKGRWALYNRIAESYISY